MTAGRLAAEPLPVSNMHRRRERVIPRHSSRARESRLYYLSRAASLFAILARACARARGIIKKHDPARLFARIITDKILRFRVG